MPSIPQHVSGTLAKSISRPQIPQRRPRIGVAEEALQIKDVDAQFASHVASANAERVHGGSLIETKLAPVALEQLRHGLGDVATNLPLRTLRTLGAACHFESRSFKFP